MYTELVNNIKSCTHNNFQQSSYAPGYGYDIYNEITIRKHKSISINTEHKPSTVHFSFNW